MSKLASISLVGLLVGCGDDGSSGGTDAPITVDTPVAVDAPIDSGLSVFSVMGKVGTGAPATGQTVVIWVVSSGSPDYTYKFGQGTSTGAQFVVSFSTVPPAAAINSYGIGVGLVAVLAQGTVIPPDGMVTTPC